MWMESQNPHPNAAKGAPLGWAPTLTVRKILGYMAPRLDRSHKSGPNLVFMGFTCPSQPYWPACPGQCELISEGEQLFFSSLLLRNLLNIFSRDSSLTCACHKASDTGNWMHNI